MEHFGSETSPGNNLKAEMHACICQPNINADQIASIYTAEMHSTVESKWSKIYKTVDDCLMSGIKSYLTGTKSFCMLWTWVNELLAWNRHRRESFSKNRLTKDFGPSKAFLACTYETHLILNACNITVQRIKNFTKNKMN